MSHDVISLFEPVCHLHREGICPSYITASVFICVSHACPNSASRWAHRHLRKATWGDWGGGKANPPARTPPLSACLLGIAGPTGLPRAEVLVCIVKSKGCQCLHSKSRFHMFGAWDPCFWFLGSGSRCPLSGMTSIFGQGIQHTDSFGFVVKSGFLCI